MKKLVRSIMKRKPLKRKPARLNRLSAKRMLTLEEDKAKRAAETERMWEVFMNIWKIRPRESEISGLTLWGRISSLYFHHILPKADYPEAMYDEENIIMITESEHVKVERNPTYYEEINKRRVVLLEKYKKGGKKNNGH